MSDSVLFSVVQTVLWTFDVYCAYGSAHTFSHINYLKSSCILPYPRLGFARFGWVYVRLGYVTLAVESGRFVLFRFYSSHCIYRRRMRSYQDTASAVLDRYDILYGGHKSDAGVGSGRCRRFVNRYGFCFSTSLWNVHLTSYPMGTRGSFPGV